MKNISSKKGIKCIAVLLTVLCLCVPFSFLASGAEDDFEKQIADFPEDYKPYLRQLHAQYPKWVFEVFETGLDFNTVVDKEYGKRSLVDSSVASDYLKGRDLGYYEWVDKKTVDFYDYSTGKYTYFDGGFVAGNKYAVSYYIDPRNFLNEEDIFQFEDLGFSSTLSVSSVDAVLKGSYMYKEPMNYLNKKGETVKVSKTYAEAIYEAGKKYNINPCYLASKIRNEVGSDGSGSSLGNRTDYPGIYNLYNIGAYDGGDAIGKGLSWASSGSSYGRPWTSPAKSIAGGAQYISERYIGIGQFTGYLQRFNVNPDADEPLYTHQYMTNLTGALSQGYTNYNSYVKMNLLDREIRFSIPVYENMPTMSSDDVAASNADSVIQNGKISVNNCNVRTGPSTNNARLYDSSSAAIKLASGTKVEILDKVKTDAAYYISVLEYPFWYNIKFTYNSKSYEGFVPATFVEITDTTEAGIGEYTLPLVEGGDLSLKAISRNVNIAKVTGDNKIKFLKTGKVEILTYNSTGEIDVVSYKVVSDHEATGELTVDKYEEKLKLTVGKTEGAEKYNFSLFDASGKLVKSTSTTKNYYTFTGLKSGERYYGYARPLLSSGVYGESVSASAMTKPATPASFKVDTGDDSVTFSWKKVSVADGYYVYGYNESTNKYTSLGKTTKTSLAVSADKLIYDSYSVRAYVKDSVGTQYSSYAEKIKVTTLPSVPKGFEVSDVTAEGYTFSWETSFNADKYKVYVYDKENDEYILLADTAETIITVSGKTAGEKDTYKLQSYNAEDTSAYSEEITLTTLPKKSSSLKAGSVTDSGAKLTWSEVTGAVAYRIYCISGSKKTLVAETDKLTYTLKSLEDVTDYTYTLVPCVKNIGNTLEGEDREVTFTTKLSAVTGLSQSGKGYDKITVKWKKNSSADYYYVYLYNSKNKEIAKKKTTSTSYEFKNLDGNATYYVKLKAEAIIGEKKYTSDYSSSFTAKTGAVAPTGMDTKDVSTTAYTITWKAVDGAYSYRLYKKSGSGYKLLAEIKKGTSYKVSGLSAGTKNTYQLTTRVKDGSKYYESPKSSAFTAATKPSKPSSLKEKVAATTTTLSWKEVKGADYYKVYLYDTKTKKYVAKGTTESTSYKLKSLTPYKEYKYAVRAYVDLTTGDVCGSYAYGDFLTKPETVGKLSVSSVKSDSHTLSWKAAKGANFYYIYRYNPSKKNYTNVGATSKTSYNVKQLVSGTTYKYKVVSAVLSGGKCITKGSDSDVYSFTTAPIQVKSLEATASSGGKISLSWAKCGGATGYAVYYYDESAEAYLSAGTTTKTSFSMSGLSKGRTLKLKVRAYRTLDGKKYYGSYSSVVTVKTK